MPINTGFEGPDIRVHSPADMRGKMEGFLENKLESVQVARDVNHFVLSLIPYERTTTYIQGTENAPDAIIEASAHMELLDDSLDVDASLYGIETLRPSITDLESITSHVRSIYTSSGNRLFGFLGGEHSITPAIIEGLGEPEIGVVWIDAHADLRESYLGRGDNHACAAFNTLPFGPITQVGVRTLSGEEADFLRESSRVAAYRHWCGEAAQRIAALPNRVYLSIDVDGLSPTLVRAVGTPEPGGLSWDEVMNILEFVFKEKEVCAFDVVELCPQPADIVSTFAVAKLTYKVMAYHALNKLVKRPPRSLL